MSRIQDIHQNKISRFGGVFVIAAFIIFLLIWFYFSRDSRLLLLSALSLYILIYGVLDDKYDLNPFLQLALQIILVFALIFFGIKVSCITNPFGGVIYLGVFAGVFTALWVIGLINAMNWIDGIDGLACSIGLIGAAVLFVLSLLPNVNQPFSAVLSGALGLILAVFLVFNFPPAKIFLGTSGSVFIGFALAVISIISGGKIATAFLVLAIPIIDAVRVAARRALFKKSIFKADRFHIHHKLLDKGFSQKKIILFLAFFSAVFGFLAIFLQTFGKFLLIILLPLTFFAILLYFF